MAMPKDAAPHRTPALPGLSVIIPAHNEARVIDACLQALARSAPLPGDAPLEVIVATNGCRDATADRARRHAPAFAARGWRLAVRELAAASKPAALDAGDGAARHAARAYLDADVVVSPPLVAALARALAVDEPRWATGRVEIAARGRLARAYARGWSAVPFVAAGGGGFGLYAVNAAGRARWRRFPPIIADDLFVRLCFAPEERVTVSAGYRWPLAEGAALVAVRRRQDRGNAELRKLAPALFANENAGGLGLAGVLRLGLRDPLALMAYAGVVAAARLWPDRQGGWARAR